MAKTQKTCKPCDDNETWFLKSFAQYLIPWLSSFKISPTLDNFRVSTKKTLLTNGQKAHNDNESSKKETTVRSKRWISYFLVINNRLCLLHFIIPKSLFITSLYNELMFIILLWTSEVTKLVLFIVSNFWSPLNLLYKTLSIIEMSWGGGGWTETETGPARWPFLLTQFRHSGVNDFAWPDGYVNLIVSLLT